MAIQKIVTAESGTAGTEVAQGSNVGGNAIDLITKTGGGSITIDATASRAANGSKSLRFSTTGTSDTALLGLTNTDSSKMLTVDAFFRFDALPAVNTTVLQIRNSGSLATLVLLTNGRLLASFTGGNGTVIGSGDPVLAPNTIYRLALGVDLGDTGTGDSSVNAAVYPVNSSTPIRSFGTTAASLGTAPITGVRFGKIVSGEATTVGYNYDDMRMISGTSDLLPAWVTNTAPVAYAGPDQTVEPWSTVTLTGTDTDDENNVATRAWTVVSGAPTNFAPSGANCTFTAPPSIAGSTVTLRYTVTDSSGATDSDDAAVTVLPVTERAVINGVEVPMQTRLS